MTPIQLPGWQMTQTDDGLLCYRRHDPSINNRFVDVIFNPDDDEYTMLFSEDEATRLTEAFDGHDDSVRQILRQAETAFFGDEHNFAIPQEEWSELQGELEMLRDTIKTFVMENQSLTQERDTLKDLLLRLSAQQRVFMQSLDDAKDPRRTAHQQARDLEFAAQVEKGLKLVLAEAARFDNPGNDDSGNEPF